METAPRSRLFTVPRDLFLVDEVVRSPALQRARRRHDGEDHLGNAFTIVEIVDEDEDEDA